jgi:hypothetical protein
MPWPAPSIRRLHGIPALGVDFDERGALLDKALDDRCTDRQHLGELTEA